MVNRIVFVVVSVFMLNLHGFSQTAGQTGVVGTGYEIGSSNASPLVVVETAAIATTYTNPQTGDPLSSYQLLGNHPANAGPGVGGPRVFVRPALFDAAGTLLDDNIGPGTWSDWGSAFTRTLDLATHLSSRQDGLYQVRWKERDVPNAPDYAFLWVERTSGPQCAALTGSVTLQGNPSTENFSVVLPGADGTQAPITGYEISVTAPNPNDYTETVSSTVATQVIDAENESLSAISINAPTGTYTVTVTVTCGELNTPHTYGTVTFSHNSSADANDPNPWSVSFQGINQDSQGNAQNFTWTCQRDPHQLWQGRIRMVGVDDAGVRHPLAINTANTSLQWEFSGTISRTQYSQGNDLQNGLYNGGFFVFFPNDQNPTGLSVAEGAAFEIPFGGSSNPDPGGGGGTDPGTGGGTGDEWTRADIDNLKASAAGTLSELQGLRGDLAADNTGSDEATYPTSTDAELDTALGNLNGGITFTSGPPVTPYQFTFPMPNGPDVQFDLPLDPRTWDTSDPMLAAAYNFSVVFRTFLAILLSIAFVKAVLKSIRQY